MKMLKVYFRDVYLSRGLLFELVRKDLTSKYKETFIGFFWNVINPIVTLAIYTFVFSVILKVKFGTKGVSSNYVLYLFCGMVPWMAFSEGVGKCTGIIVSNASLVKKAVFPLEVLPCYAVISSMVTELIELGILLIATLIVVKSLGVSLIVVPPLIILLSFFSLGLGMFFASLTVFFRDVGHFVGIILRVWVYLTPIMYPETLFPERLRFLLWINPMALIVGMFRDIVLEGTFPSPWKFGVFSIWAFVLFYGGLFFFRKTKWEFADVI